MADPSRRAARARHLHGTSCGSWGFRLHGPLRHAASSLSPLYQPPLPQQNAMMSCHKGPWGRITVLLVIIGVLHLLSAFPGKAFKTRACCKGMTRANTQRTRRGPIRRGHDLFRACPQRIFLASGNFRDWFNRLLLVASAEESLVFSTLDYGRKGGGSAFARPSKTHLPKLNPTLEPEP